MGLRRPLRLAASLILTACIPCLARAQEAEPRGATPPSRAALLEAARRAKAESLQPPERAFLENLLYRGERNLIPQKIAAGYAGFTIASGGMPTGNGMDLGIGFADEGIGVAYPQADTPNRVELATSATVSTERFRQVRGRVTWHEIGGTRLAASVYAHAFRWPRREFFGRGPRPVGTETTYAEEGTEVGGDLWMRIGDRSRMGVGLYRLDPDTGPGTDEDEPSTRDVFGPDQAPGLERDADFRRLDAFVELDRLDNPAFPRAGGWYSLRFSDYRDSRSGAYSFRRYEADLHRYLPFQDRRKVVALRAMTVLTDPGRGSDVPVYLWPTLGSSRRLRGFESARLQDRNMLLLPTEYRWQIWWSLDAALFLDLGNVTERPRDLFDDMRAAYGLGLRLHSLEALIGRLDLAFRDDGGFRAHLSFSYPFAPGGLAR